MKHEIVKYKGNKIAGRIAAVALFAFLGTASERFSLKDVEQAFAIHTEVPSVPVIDLAMNVVADNEGRESIEVLVRGRNIDTSDNLWTVLRPFNLGKGKYPEEYPAVPVAYSGPYSLNKYFGLRLAGRVYAIAGDRYSSVTIEPEGEYVVQICKGPPISDIGKELILGECIASVAFRLPDLNHVNNVE